MAAAWADRAAAAVALDAGEPAAAAERALASAAAADRAGAVVEAACRGRSPGGRWRRPATATAPRPSSSGGRRRSRPAARCAIATRPSASCESSAAASTGARAGRGGGRGFESLTERELQVARLVVDRKTNREIAAELFLSPKTVETHMRNMFRKLDVSSRVEVARTVERAERSQGSE